MPQFDIYVLVPLLEWNYKRLPMLKLARPHFAFIWWILAIKCSCNFFSFSFRYCETAIFLSVLFLEFRIYISFYILNYIIVALRIGKYILMVLYLYHFSIWWNKRNVCPFIMWNLCALNSHLSTVHTKNSKLQSINMTNKHQYNSQHL